MNTIVYYKNEKTGETSYTKPDYPFGWVKITESWWYDQLGSREIEDC